MKYILIYKIFSATYSLFIMFLLGLTLSSLSYGSSDPITLTKSEAVDFLETAIASTKTNYELIRTWKGEFKIKEDNYYYGENCRHLPVKESDSNADPNCIRRRLTALVKFTADIENDKLYTELIPKVKFRAIDLKRDLNMDTRYSRIKSILTSEAYLSYEPNHVYAYDTVIDGKKRVHSSAAFKWPLKKAFQEQWGQVRDPRKYFSQSNRAIWEHLNTLRDILTGEIGGDVDSYFDINITKLFLNDCTKYIIKNQVSHPVDKDVSIIRVLDSSVRFNLIELNVIDKVGRLLQTLDFTYEQIEGVCLPKTVHFVIFSPDGQKKLFDSQITFIKSLLNKPIQSKTFTYRDLGLKEGVKLIDKIKNKKYTYQNAKLVLDKDNTKKQ